MNHGIQEAVLYGLMSYGDRAFRENADQLHAEMFTGPNRLIFERIRDRLADGRPVDIVCIADDLPDCDAVDDLKTAWCGPSELPKYIAELGRSWAISREALLGEELLRGQKDRETVIRELRELDQRTNRADVFNVQETFGAWFQEIEAGIANPCEGIRTGWSDVDKLLGGVRPGNVMVLAGRPSMGKTAAAINIAAHQTGTVLLFSLEMTKSEVMNRLVSGTGIDHAHLRTPRLLTDDDWPRMTSAMRSLSARKILINDTGGISIGGIEAVATRTHAVHALSLIVIDYLQLVTCKAENRLQEVSEVSRRLKALAKNLNVAIIALAQLNRAVEGRLDPVPKMSDLRESGQIEQDADQIVFVHRPEVFDANDRPGEAEMWVRKNRHGETGMARLTWQGRFQRFMNWAGMPDFDAGRLAA